MFMTHNKLEIIFSQTTFALWRYMPFENEFCYGQVLCQYCSDAIRNTNRKTEWKNRNVVPIQKKDDENCLKNYRPVSLLRNCGKSFEKLISNEMFKSFIENELISPNQNK